jgi:hypothetical protein
MIVPCPSVQLEGREALKGGASARVGGKSCALLAAAALAFCAYRLALGPQNSARLLAAEPAKAIDPAAWGSDHVGKGLPEFVTGGECLFCHRSTVGPTWDKNPHNQTIREADPADPALAAMKAAGGLGTFADEVKLFLGRRQRLRFLRPAKDYGHLELLTVQWSPARGQEPGKVLDSANPHWETKRFNDACAGCHATAVESKSRAFAMATLDCFACHGDVPLEHTKNTTLVYLSKKRQDSPRVVTSLCAQCHVRTGKSKSTGLPYPNQFVVGDNLFRDFAVDFSESALAKLNPGDRHVLENVRDVVVLGKEDVTCLSCHEVHKQSSRKHRQVSVGPSCWACHNEQGSRKVRKSYEVHSDTCGY